MKHLTALFIGLLLSGTLLAENTSTIPLGLFSKGQLSNWQEKEFSNKTQYHLSQIEGIQALKAESNSSASGLFKAQRIDLHKTPYLNWRWRINNHLGAINEQQKTGDDYSARIYVVIDGGWAFWKTQAINYVWSSNTAKGTVWPNAFAGKNAMMIAIRSKEDKIHTWYQEKRNFLVDLKKQFGNNIQYIDAIAVMTDTDNAKGHAIAYYGDIYFSEK